MSKHAAEKQFECNECHQKFTFETGLNKHIRLKRCKGSVLEDVKINELEVRQMVMNQLKEISCHDPKFTKRKKRKINVIKKVAEIVEDTTFDHDDSVGDASEEGSVQKKKKIISGRRHLVYCCDKCGEEIKYRKNIERHMKERHMAGRHNCKFCNDTFKSKQKLFDHSLAVHNVKSRVAAGKFSCKYCDKKFDTKSVFEEHKKSHLEDRPEICSICGCSFKSISNLHRHQQSVHATGRNEICELCDKAFKTKIALKNHKNVMHADIRIYVSCTFCKLIIQENCLKSHILNVHTEQEKKYECDVCQKLFKTEPLLRRHHRNVHESVCRGISYVCSDCEYKTTRLRDLRNHQLDAHYEGPIHVCHECGKKFKSRRLLHIHISNHNYDKIAIKCDFCDATFKTRSGMRKHVMRLHQKSQWCTSVL